MQPHHFQGEKIEISNSYNFGSEVSIDAGLLDPFKRDKAIEAYSRGDYNNSIKLLQEIENRDREVNIALANSYYHLGEYKKAVEIYNKIDKRDDRLNYNLANSYYKLGEYKKALETYQKIKNKEMEFKKFHNIGNSFAQLKSLIRGLRAMRRLLR